ncbi:MAG: DUF1792 domain-containing protein [Ignavibacteriae bacterium]|nr:DUF1792 domain-containing protein [Ignavibacteriota bacterium]
MMNIRYSKAFKIPRTIVKNILVFLYPLIIKIWPLPIVKSIDTTLDKLISNNCSISRFGDGEFLFLIDKLNLPFQKYEPRLAAILKQALLSEDSNVLIGLPVGYENLTGLSKSSQYTWRSQIAWIYPRLNKYLKKDKVYYNASITRPYMDYEDKKKSKGWFIKLKQLWERKNVLLIEGDKSRLGVGNNLFENVLSLQRIIGPAHNAFSKYDELKSLALKEGKYKLVLIAMGPTATALSFELALEGLQCIDIGNVDIEYEWFLREATSKIKIPLKYTSEAIGGRNVGDIVDGDYESQIIYKVL